MLGRALASLVLAVTCIASAPAGADDTSTDFDLLIQTCFADAPDFSRVEARLLAAGGQPEERAGYGAFHSGLDDVREIGLWSGPATYDPDRVWLIGVSEGEWRGMPARACYGVQSVHNARKFPHIVSLRWPMTLVDERPSMPLGFVERDYTTRVNGAILHVNLHLAADHTFPLVRVIVVEEEGA